MLYICIFSNKFDLIQAIHVSHTNDRLVTSSLAKLINYKEAAQLALLILNEEGETQAEIGTLCDGQCPACDSENDYFKRNLLQ